MNKLKQLPIGKQVLFAFGVLSTILLAIGGLFLFSLRSIEHNNQLQQSRALKKLALIDDEAQDVGQMQAAVLREVLASDISEIEKLDQTVRDLEKTNAKELADYQSFIDTKNEKQPYAKVMQAQRTFWEQTEPVLALGRANRDAQAIALINSKQGAAYDQFLKAINELIDDVEANAQDAATAMTRFISWIRIIGDTLAVIAILIAVGTGFAVARIARELKEDNRVLQNEVSERKRAEETVRQSEGKFRQLADNITDVFWMTSPDLQTIHYVSPAYEQIWGYPVESVYANPQQWADAILPEQRERVFATFLKLADEPSVSTEFQIVRPDGAVRWIFSRGFQVRDPGGNVIRLTGIATDMTERKRAEVLFRETKERLDHLISANPAVIYSLKFENGVLAPTWISDNITKLTGHKPEEVYAPNWWRDHLHPDDRDRVVAEHAVPFPDDHLLTEYRFQRKDGSHFWVRDEKVLLRDTSGKPAEVVGSWADITERKRVEEHLFQSQKMETVGKLASGIAHEFNTIMTTIIGHSEMMLGDLPAGDPLCKNAQEIRQAADKAAMLTRQLLAYGRKQILQPKILDLNTLIADMEGMLQHLMGSDVDVRTVPSVGLTPVKADAGQIEQVVMNIAMNAADAMPNGGKLTLETATVTLDEEYVRRFPDLKAGEYVMLAITDTGAGMTEEVKARLFEPFFTTKGVGKGTGLGLATCHGIIKQSGGHIAVYSEPGRGATFKVYLPQVEQPTKVIAPRGVPAELPRGTEAILVVEDDPALREMSAALLKRLGYTVLAAANGVEALKLTHQQGTGHIDLLFTDVVMPQMSGKELSDRIHALRPNTKILFASAYAENAIVHQGVLDDGVQLLQKPFTPSALASKVREVLNSSSKN